MRINLKRIVKFLFYIFIGIVIIHLGLYLRFLYVMNNWWLIQIVKINPVITETDNWKWLPWMKKYCIDEWVEKSNISCK